MNLTSDNTFNADCPLHRAAHALYPAGVVALAVLLVAGLFI